MVLCSCYKNHLYVQQEWVDRDFLASTKINTPDPRQAAPPEGQRLLISWDFPRSLFQEKLILVSTVRFWDNTEECLREPIERKRGYTAYFFPSAKILTYRVQVFNVEGEAVETWEHHFWTELIDVDVDKSNSVSSHPMQLSVIETP